MLLPKKNGKTTVMAALALYHLVVTPNAECIIVAASREQAEIMLRQARMFIRSNDSLARLVRLSQRTVSSLGDEGRIRVLAADADTADGVIPTLAIVDELHRHRNAELYGVLSDGLGPRGGQLLTISTAGATMASPLGAIRTKAHELPSFTRSGTYNYAESEDGTFAFHEWCIDEKADPEDMDVVKAANPAPWHTKAALLKRRNQPGMTPWRWLRFACGIWTEGEEPWIDPPKWDSAAASEPYDLPDGTRIVLGVDAEPRKETAALVLLEITEDGKLRVKTRLRERQQLEDVEHDIRILAERYEVLGLVYVDRAFERSADLLESEGMNVLMIPDAPKRKEEMAATLHKVIEEGRLIHDGDPEFRAQVLAGRVKESESGWRFVRDPQLPRPINALVALAAAVHITETEFAGGSEHWVMVI